MQSFIHTVLIIWSGFCFSFGQSNEHQQAWSLRISDSARDGRFLNVPIYYGDWVPISKAKQTIEAVASKIEAAVKPPVRRKDPPPEIITADQPEDRLDIVVSHVPYEVHPSQQQQHQRHHWSQQQQHQKHPHQRYHHQNHQRPQWSRRNDRTRGHRKLPPPSPFVNQFTSLFQQQSQQQAAEVTTAKPEEVSTQASSGFNLGSVFNFLNPLIQHKPDIILNDSPAIKTLPAPDLSQVRFFYSNKVDLILINNNFVL